MNGRSRITWSSNSSLRRKNFDCKNLKSLTALRDTVVGCFELWDHGNFILSMASFIDIRKSLRCLDKVLCYIDGLVKVFQNCSSKTVDLITIPKLANHTTSQLFEISLFKHSSALYFRGIQSFTRSISHQLIHSPGLSIYYSAHQPC